MKKTFSFSLFLITLLIATSYSQVHQEWVQRYNGPGSGTDFGISIAVDGSGNVYVTGGSWGNGTGYDYVTIKYNTSGVQQWVQRYNGPGNGDDWTYSIVVDGSGNSYVTGYSYGNGTSWDYATIKYNTNGIQQWVQRYNGPGNSSDEAHSIAVDASGNVYVTGFSTGNGTGDDYTTIKYNTNGVQLWVQRYNGPVNNEDAASSVAVDGSGNVYVTGWSIGSGTYYDYATIKYNAGGVQQWLQRYDRTGDDDKAYSIAVDASGNVYVTGYAYGSVAIRDYLTIKYNSNGAQQWLQSYNGPGNVNDYATSIVVDGSGNVYVTGYSAGNGTQNDFATIKYSQNIGIKPISSEVPDKYYLYQNYPNPFNPSTKIKFSLPFPSQGGVKAPLSFGEGLGVWLCIYDLLGREVETLINEQLKPGSYEVEWDASKYMSGVYFYRLISNEFSETRKMVLAK
jgi:uncharacterized delta-60 repeat protein